MARVVLWGNSSEQVRSLPRSVQDAFAWVIDALARDPSAFPARETPLKVVTQELHGSLPLVRIKVVRSKTDAGFRGVYFVDGDEVVFLYFANRDEATYRRLKALYGRALTRAVPEKVRASSGAG